MFKIGDIIVYGAQGICKITSTETNQIGKVSAEYFVLSPIFSDNTSLFVPVQNEKLVSRMQPVLTVDEANSLIAAAPDTDVLNIKDETQKREEYKNILASNDRHKLLSLIKTICVEKDFRREHGKKLNINDEQTLRKAELLLYNELGFVLNIDPKEVKGIIKL